LHFFFKLILQTYVEPAFFIVNNAGFDDAKRYSKRTSSSNSLSTTLGQILANLLRVHPRTSNCIIHSKGEKSLCSFKKVNYNQETDCLLNCEFPEHKGKRFLECSEVVKRIFTKIVANLK